MLTAPSELASPRMNSASPRGRAAQRTISAVGDMSGLLRLEEKVVPVHEGRGSRSKGATTGLDGPFPRGFRGDSREQCKPALATHPAGFSRDGKCRGSHGANDLA